jgi:hypothetical protein
MIMSCYDMIISSANYLPFTFMNPHHCIAAVVAATLLAANGLVGDDVEPKPLTPIEARKKIGEQIVVEMLVRAVKDRLEKRGEIYLDAELDFRDEKNFATVINRDGAAEFQRQGVTDIESHFRGKTIRVKGIVTVIDEVPRIEVSDPKQVKIAEMK